MLARLVAVLFAVAVVVFVPAVSAQAKPPINVTGVWQIMWDNNKTNFNNFAVDYKDGTLTGSYANDGGGSCPIVGRFDNNGTSLMLIIMCPDWEIMTKGDIRNPKLVEGRYVAYGGKTKGDFRMARL